MVFPSEGDMMATGDVRPKKALHNFRFSSWGSQQSLRCVKVEPYGGSEGIAEFREKMMLDIRRVKESIFREHVLDYEEEEEEKEKKERETEVSPVEGKRWNLRKRRADCEAPFTELGFVEEKVNNTSIRSMFKSTLSKKEVEDDMMKMGQRPPRRPKKRPKTLQKKINLLHPALYFSEVTEDIY
ncbi:hypothetical protein N665_1209s0010 [Sinapis alba]|nr:hypothetical protein N665_1209s0010 [Sinapis alba]